MRFVETLIFYNIIGAGVAAAVFLTERGSKASRRMFQVLTSLVFWPLYLPMLLTRSQGAVNHAETWPRASKVDEMDRTITQVEAELELAFASLGGWAESVLSREAVRLRELGAAWRAQAQRIREMDRILANAPPAEISSPTPFVTSGTSSRFRQSEQLRQSNIARLHQMRNRALNDLMDTLAWVRELVSMIHLAKFTGAPATRAEELVSQIAAAIEGLSMVSGTDLPTQSVPTSPSDPRTYPMKEEPIPCGFSDV